jgi:CBS-domain-containing membrane protein
MVAITTSLLDLTAVDLMSRDVVTIPTNMSLPAAARLLWQAGLSGAPVVDADKRCVGVLSATDFLRWSGRQDGFHSAGPSESSRPCSFRVQGWGKDDKELFLCAIPPGGCPYQGPRRGPIAREEAGPRPSHCVCTDWQMMEGGDLPLEEVADYMTADLATASPDTPIADLARMMIDADIHRLIVVDEAGRPAGVVSSTDLLAALAAAAAAPGA